MRVKYSYLAEQFADVESYFDDLRELVATGEFTLGPFVERFEQKFARYVGVTHAIGTNTGTGALTLALKAVGVKPGDEVITVANTFVATVGAIVAAGGRPVFVDCDDRYQIDPNRLERAVTPATRAVIPVHWAGCPCDIAAVTDIARRRRIAVVEDACPAVGATVDGRFAGTFGDVNAFSMHPLKPLNVWGDGGIIVSDNDEIARWLRLYRNHGLVDRENVAFWGVNERVQPVQAIVAMRVLDTIDDLIAARIRNARALDRGLAGVSGIRIPRRPAGMREVYQLYLVSAVRRDELARFLVSRGIEAKVHYPIPLHLQEAARGLGYRRGDFPEAERYADETLTIPAHQHVTAEQVAHTVQSIREFYS